MAVLYDGLCACVYLSDGCAFVSFFLVNSDKSR